MFLIEQKKSVIIANHLRKEKKSTEKLVKIMAKVGESVALSDLRKTNSICIGLKFVGLVHLVSSNRLSVQCTTTMYFVQL